jgi:hypothetical protein
VTKYLVILAGLPRGGEPTWKSIFKNLVKPLGADLAICTGNEIDKNSTLYKKSDYKWLFKEYEDWFDYYNENFSGDWRKVFELGLDTGLYNSGSVHFAIKDIIRRNYLDTIKKYDYFIYSRFDQFFIMEHPKFMGDNIWIPEGENYTGICDRHAVVPSKYGEEYLNICNYLDTRLFKSSIPGYLNCEAVYKMHLKDSDLLKVVKRFRRFQFTTSKKNDFTRWRVAKYKLYFYKDVYLKYPNEFLDSVQTLISNRKLMLLSTLRFRELINFGYLRSRILIGKIKTGIYK